MAQLEKLFCAPLRGAQTFGREELFFFVSCRGPKGVKGRSSTLRERIFLERNAMLT
jgi:hypothetical protein